MTDNNWQLFSIDDLKKRLSGAAVEYLEFFDVPSIHCGLYRLEKGASDMQQPHDEDEMYFVLEGRGSIEIDGSPREVKPGMLLYVGATESHSFFEIHEDMLLLVLFATGGDRSRTTPR